MMGFLNLLMIFPIFGLVGLRVVVFAGTHNVPTYDHNYEVLYGAQHILPFHQRREIGLSLDESSGSGIKSKFNYTSGFFHMNIKLPANDSGGVVTAFYLKSEDSELDFEFLGNRKGKPIGVQTNAFLKGKGGREQRIYLWFDPTANFHTYKILWNQHQIVYFVDEYPIRVFKNNRHDGVGFPAQPMQLMATIWDGDSWATNGGKTKIIWAHAPFISHFRGFAIDGCPYDSSHRKSCNSPKFWWNGKNYWQLSPNQERRHQVIKAQLYVL
ncbi:unnamed protein product [Camellia sinensis]